ncbi:MAG: protein translocase subunit SecD [Gemmatimonadota bacterium]|nr:protein translocase subunit SecD [Gemmatimonadota bacterium]
MSNIRYRLLTIAVLILASIFALYPRKVTIAVRDRVSGQMVKQEVTRIPLKKGLDLQGGMHLALEIDESKGTVANKADAIQRAVKVVRNRIDQFGVSEPVVQTVGTERIIVELPGIDDPRRAQQLVDQQAFLQFQITDKTNALDKVLTRLDGIVRQKGGATIAQTGVATPGVPLGKDTAANALGNLLAKADTGKAATDSAKKADSTNVLGQTNNGPFSKLIQPGGMAGEYYVARTDIPAMEAYLAMPEVQAALPPGKSIHWGVDEPTAPPNAPRAFYVVDTRAIIDGQSLIDAKPNTDPMEGNIVQFTLSNEGGRKFQRETAKHIKDYMAIVLDDRVQGRPPIIQGAISTHGQITMSGKPLQEAQDLALVLRSGALPVKLHTVEVRRIGPSLGEDSIRAGLRAGVLGVLLVVGIMLVYYRFSGLLAVSALTLYVLFTLAALAGFDAVLTLPGLAGFVLSIGIAVDANVLIFERIREELDHGKTVRAAIDEGFQHAMSAIIDSNVTTMLTAIVLYWVGTGPVRGFAVTLIAGILASMVSSIFVVRTFFLLWLNRTRGAQTLSI